MKKFVSFLLTLVCIALVVAIGYVALCFVKDDDVIWEHVRINGVSVAGLTREQAEEAVEDVPPSVPQAIPRGDVRGGPDSSRGAAARAAARLHEPPQPRAHRETLLVYG